MQQRNTGRNKGKNELFEEDYGTADWELKTSKSGAEKESCLRARVREEMNVDEYEGKGQGECACVCVYVGMSQVADWVKKTGRM